MKRKQLPSNKRQGNLTNRPDLLPPNADVLSRELSPPAVDGYPVNVKAPPQSLEEGHDVSVATKPYHSTLSSTFDDSQMMMSAVDQNQQHSSAAATTSYISATSTTPTSFRK